MKLKNWTLVDTLFWLGGGLIAVGVGLWAVPAGLIAAGMLCLAGGVLIDRSGGKEPSAEKKGGDGA